MLTPKFSLSQNADFLFIHLHVPYIKTENAECEANGDEFYFSAKPYYLRLHLPGNVINDDRLKSEFDVDQGDLNIRVPKEVPGQKFDGLDMLTKLMTPKQTFSIPNIEVIDSQAEIHDVYQNTDCQNEIENDLSCDNDGENVPDDFDFDWFIEQKVPEDASNDIHITTNTVRYGFANKKCNVIGDVCSEIDAIDLKDPDNVPSSERTLLREKQEEQDFDCEHYLADLFDDELIQDVIAADYPILTGVDSISKDKFSDSERERLMRLPKREYIVEHDAITQVYLGLVDLVYAYSYNYRFCGGEFNIESDWTICKLSATLSWLDSFHNLKNVVVSCARRTLCFPLYRSWKMFAKVYSDVKQIFKSGKSQILKCLLGIHSILEKSESKYLLNDLYVTDYCVWIQAVDSKVIDSLASNLSKLDISKEDVGLSVAQIEADADKLMLECPSDDEDVDDVTKKLKNVVHIADGDGNDSDDDCEDGREEDESSDSSEEEEDDESDEEEDEDGESDEEEDEDEKSDEEEDEDEKRDEEEDEINDHQEVEGKSKCGDNDKDGLRE